MGGILNDNPDTPKGGHRRRWYQFSLRTLLIVVTLSTVPLGWVGWKLEQGRRQRATIAWVEKMGGYVGFEDREEKSWWNEWTDEWFGESVQLVNLGETQVSDLSPLAELKNLEELSLNYSPVSDLSPLAELKKLELLWLNMTAVSDLSPMAKLKYLEQLSHYKTQVSDEQVEKLRKALPNCEIRYSIRNRK